MDYDGYEPKQITADGFLNLMPDGRRIAGLLSSRPIGAGTRRTSIFWSSRREALDAGVHAGIEHHPGLVAGRKLFGLCQQPGRQFGIYKARHADQGSQRLTVNQEAICRPPGLRPDEIAFTSDRGGAPQVFVMSADETNVRRLTYEGITMPHRPGRRAAIGSPMSVERPSGCTNCASCP